MSVVISNLYIASDINSSVTNLKKKSEEGRRELLEGSWVTHIGTTERGGSGNFCDWNWGVDSPSPIPDAVCWLHLLRLILVVTGTSGPHAVPHSPSKKQGSSPLLQDEGTGGGLL